MKSLAPLSLAVCALAAPTLAQRLVSLDGTPAVTQIEVPPSVVVPACLPVPGFCPVPLPAFPPGNVAPSVGGEAVDEAGGVLYTSDGFTVAASTYPGCAPGPVFPLQAWPPGPCGPFGVAPLVAMCDAAGVGSFWMLDARGVVSLLPFPPGPPIAQAIVPAALIGSATGLTWDPATNAMYFVGGFAPMVFATATPVGFVCAPLAIAAAFPIPACLPPPYVGVTLHTATIPGPLPALVVSNGIIVADVAAGNCPCPVLPPALIPATDIDFATVPKSYGAGCGCPSVIGTTGGLPVLGNGAFAIDANRAPIGSFGVLMLSTAPALIPLGFGCNLLLAPPLLTLPAVPVVPIGPGVCGGNATLPLPIPPNAVLLVGTPFYFQWVFLPVAGPLGFELSDALELVIGFA
jgi:hypothetical protein